MPTTKRTSRRLGGLLAALAVLSLGADDKTQDVTADGLSFQAPASWKSIAPQGMRKAELRVEGGEGEVKQTAEVVVYAFPGTGGGVDANVARWQQTFKDKDGNPPKVDVKTVKGKNVDVSRVEMAGDYTPSSFGSAKKQEERKEHRLIGAIVITDDVGYFIRFVGPDKLVSDSRPAFDKLISSIKVEKK